MRLSNAGATLRRLREAKGVSLSGLAALIRRDPGYLSKLERGILNVTIEGIVEIAKHLDYDPNVVLLLCLAQSHPGIFHARALRKAKDMLWRINRGLLAIEPRSRNSKKAIGASRRRII
jgi:transcriptional regulator with XRE-family HTH domain